MNWIKNSDHKDVSITEKADKQKCYDVELTYFDEIKKTSMWAISLEEAIDKVYFKYPNADKREVTENTFSK